MVVVAGSRYYLLVNACRTVCTFVRTVEDVEGQKFLIAVPAANFTFDPKTDRAVATTTENTTELVRFLFIRSLSGCRLAPNPSFPYREWAHKPRLDALESVITAEPEILPLKAAQTPASVSAKTTSPAEMISTIFERRRRKDSFRLAASGSCVSCSE